MMRFEYLRVPFEKVAVGNSVRTKLLNEYGERGWELVSITNWNGSPAFVYFKRQTKVKKTKEE